MFLSRTNEPSSGNEVGGLGGRCGGRAAGDKGMVFLSLRRIMVGCVGKSHDTLLTGPCFRSTTGTKTTESSRASFTTNIQPSVNM
ncbi:hypothetical protein CRUP_032843 [Coryphaenoides rupestris]|nr:hypothetical protein CRUP_032843 [Coryphaenoides rupestris]